MSRFDKTQSEIDDIERTAALLMGPGEVLELRALGVSTAKYRAPHTVSGYFDNPVKLAQATRSIHGAKGIYLTLNPVDPALLGRAYNRAKNIGKGDNTTSDSNIVRRRTMVIDFDPDRLQGISASDEEKESAHLIAREVRDYLQSEGWPEPLIGDSGNGYHLVYRIDLPADDGGLVKRCLSALAD